MGMVPLSYSVCSSCSSINRVRLGNPSQAVCGQCRADLPFERGLSRLSASQVNSLISKSPLPVLVDFWAPWCAPCRAFAPTFEAAAVAWAGQFVFAKVDTEAHTLAGQIFGIRSLPTLAIFRSGVEVKRISGALSPAQLDAWLKEASSLNS